MSRTDPKRATVRYFAGHAAALPDHVDPTLYVRDVSGASAPASDAAILAQARLIATRRMRKGAKVFTSPAVARELVRTRLAHLDHEVFCVAFLDSRHRLIAFKEMFRGTLDGASVHPREVLKQALAHCAACVAFAHNHPSGDPNPSHADEIITRRLRQALSLVEIRTLDHLIVAGDSVTSMAEKGLL